MFFRGLLDRSFFSTAVVPTRILLIRAKCDLRTCFDQIRGKGSSKQRHTADGRQTHSVKSGRGESRREFYPDNSDTSVCKTNSIGNQ